MSGQSNVNTGPVIAVFVTSSSCALPVNVVTVISPNSSPSVVAAISRARAAAAGAPRSCVPSPRSWPAPERVVRRDPLRRVALAERLHDLARDHLVPVGDLGRIVRVALQILDDRAFHGRDVVEPVELPRVRPALGG